MDSANNKLERLKELIDRVFGTDYGEQLLELLKEEYSSRSVVRESTELTYYCLGQKELIDTLESIKKDDEFLEKINVITD